jgi:hypothetical protein
MADRIVSISDAVEAWHRGNDAGQGFSVGEEDQSPREAAESEGWRILASEYGTDLVLAEKPNGDWVIVAYSVRNGPWAVSWPTSWECGVPCWRTADEQIEHARNLRERIEKKFGLNNSDK